MATKAIIRISQIESLPSFGRVREQRFTRSGTVEVRDIAASKAGSMILRHLPAVTNPSPKGSSTGWGTDDAEDWSDAPVRQPLLLYRHRFSFGRDRRELFPSLGFPPLDEEEDGQKWGDLSDYSGVLIYEEQAGLSGSTRLRAFRVANSAKVRNQSTVFSSKLTAVKQFKGASGNGDLTEFPFLVFAEPEPYSEKNPIDTDIFIRLSNFATPLASGTISLYVNGQLQPGLNVQPFFAGLGGFDVTWENDQVFDYDSRVSVRWEFFDTSIPARKYVIAYPFDIVEDFAAPRVINLVPADQAVGVSIRGPVQFDVVDFEHGVNIESLIIYVNNVRIVNGENATVQLFPFDDETGYTVRITPVEPWFYGDSIPVAIFVKDTSPRENELFFSYSFTTAESLAPRILRTNPRPCALGVPILTDIELDIIDGGHGIDTKTVVLSVEDIEKTTLAQIIPIIHRDS